MSIQLQLTSMEQAVKPLPVLKFRPFRIVDLDVIVTSYLGWRKVVTHTNNGGHVALFERLDIVKESHVKNHKGDWLYWFSEQGFREMPILDRRYFIHPLYDCDGVPVFSHVDAKRVVNSTYKHLFEPLRTSTVVRAYHEMIERFNVKQVKLIN